MENWPHAETAEPLDRVSLCRHYASAALAVVGMITMAFAASSIEPVPMQVGALLAMLLGLLLLKN